MKGYNMLSPEDIAENIQTCLREEILKMGVSVNYTYSYQGMDRVMDDANTWD